MRTDHEHDVGLLHLVVGLFEDGLEQERVLGEPLQGPHEDVEQAQAVAVPLSLAPLKQQAVKSAPWENARS